MAAWKVDGGYVNVIIRAKPVKHLKKGTMYVAKDEKDEEDSWDLMDWRDGDEEFTDWTKYKVIAQI